MTEQANTRGKVPTSAAAHIEGRDRPLPEPGSVDFPAAGPHARDRLTDPSKTPGAGTLANPGRPRETDATGG